MKVNMNLEALNIDIYSKVHAMLEQANRPVCLGSMFLPVLTHAPKIEIEDYFKPAKSISPENIVAVDLDSLVSPEDKQYVDGKVLSKEAHQKLTALLYEDATEYASKAIKCSNCVHVDVCYKLSFLYIEKIKLRYTIE